jgi:tetratricopeptide (TPR) repeat protein
MNGFARGLAVALLFALAPSLALAGDKEAMDLYQQAAQHWKDPDPAQAVGLAEKALAQAQSKKMKTNVLVMLGQLHQGKTGDFEKALTYYEEVIRSVLSANEKDNSLLSLKAQALLGKGTILYSEKDDVDGALAAYQGAPKNYPSAQSADTLGQLCYRIGRDPNKSMDARAKQLEYSEKLSVEALHHDEKNTNKAGNAPRTAKYRLQLAIVLLAQGKTDESAEVWKNTEQDKLDANAFYQLAIYEALQGKDAAAVGATLRKCLTPDVRPKARARNQLRKFIKTEPDLSKFLTDKGWKDLVTDEPEDKG